MKLEEFVSKSEIEIARTPQAYLTWFESLLLKTKDIEDEELNQQMLTHTGIAKKFYEELFPLYRLLQQKKDEWATVLVRNVLGSQGGDVEVIVDVANFPSIPKKLELTYAVSGKDHMLRMKYLAKYGWTTMSGPISEVTEEGQKILHAEPEAVECDKVVAKVFDLIKERIEAKAKNLYGDKTGLLVYIEDDGTIQHSPKQQAKLHALGTGFLPQLKDVFHVIYLVLASSGKVIELQP